VFIDPLYQCLERTVNLAARCREFTWLLWLDDTQSGLVAESLETGIGQATQNQAVRRAGQVRRKNRVVVDKGWCLCFPIRNCKAVSVEDDEKGMETIPQFGEVGAFGRADDEQRRTCVITTPEMLPACDLMNGTVLLRKKVGGEEVVEPCASLVGFDLPVPEFTLGIGREIGNDVALLVAQHIPPPRESTDILSRNI